MASPRLLTSDEKQNLRPRSSRMEQLVADRSGMVEAAWAWYDKRQGVVEWGFRNSDSVQRSVVLLRNKYYFGNGFWSIYCSNREFRTSFLDGAVSPPLPLPERGVPQNTAPLGLLQFGDSEHSNVCLVFSLAPGQAWGMLEGGFAQVTPNGVSIHNVTPITSGDYCLTYDPQAVRDWDSQTRTRLEAYTPNPSTFNTWLFQAEPSAPYGKFYAGDSMYKGRCLPSVTKTARSEAVRRPQDDSSMFPPVFPDVLMPPLNP